MIVGKLIVELHSTGAISVAGLYSEEYAQWKGEHGTEVLIEMRKIVPQLEEDDDPDDTPLLHDPGGEG